MCVGNSGQLSITFLPSMEACIIEWLIPQSPEVGVQVQTLPVALFPQTRNFTPLCISLPKCINGYQRHTVGGNLAMD